MGAPGERGGVRPGHAGRSRAASATSPTYGRHVASVGWRRVGASARGVEGEKLGRARAGRKGGGWPSSACPLFLNFFFPKELKCEF